MLRALALLVLALAPASALAQDDPQATLAKFKSYLERRPFHGPAFERLVQSAVSIDGLGDLIAELEQSDGTDEQKILLARLYVEVDRDEEALALLDGMEGSADLHLLTGQLALSGGDHERAQQEFSLAAQSSTDPLQLEEIHVARGQVALRLGHLDEAKTAFEDLANLDPESFHLRVLTAESMADAGLTDEAIEAYRVAADLAGSDVARRCRAMAAGGALLEASDRGLEAIELYDRAVDMMGRGNWLKRDLLDRVLAIHRRAGTLEDLAANLADVPAQDLDRRQLRARTFEALHRFERAVEVLDGAVEHFPTDLSLGRHRLSLFEELGDTDRTVAEYQRLIAEHPGEVTLYLDLGSLLAGEGQLEQARLQWRMSLDERLDDAHLCGQLAQLYASHGLTDDALASLERAIELEPQELSHLAEMASVLIQADRRDEIEAVLDRMFLMAHGGGASTWEEVADLASGLRFPDRARAALGEALALEPHSPRALRSMAELAQSSGDRAAAAEALRTLVYHGRDDGARKDAAGRLLRLQQRNLSDLDDAEEASDHPAALYLRARIAEARRRNSLAIKYYEQYIEQGEDGELGVLELARIHVERGNEDDAIELYEVMIERRPTARSQWMRRIAGLYAQAGKRTKAIAAYEELLDLAPDNAANFATVATELAELGREERAIECYQQSLRLDPGQGHVRLLLASLLREEDMGDAAREQALIAAETDDDDIRDRARGFLHQDLVDRGVVREELGRLRAAVAANPYDLESGDELLDLLVRELEYYLALELIADRLVVDRTNADLYLTRAKLRVDMWLHAEALEDYEAAARLPGVNQEDLRYDIARCALLLDDVERARRALVGAADPIRAAATLRKEGQVDLAITTLEAARVHYPSDPRLCSELVRLYERVKRFEDALDVQIELSRLQGDGDESLLAQVRLLASTDQQARLVEVAGTLLERTQLPELDETLTSKVKRKRDLRQKRSAHRKDLALISETYSMVSQQGAFVEAARARLKTHPEDQDLLTTVINLLAPNGFFMGSEVFTDYPEALAVLEEVRASSFVDPPRLPLEMDEEDWTKVLDNIEERILQADPSLAKQKAGMITKEDIQAMSTKQLDGHIQTLRSAEDFEGLQETLEIAAERFPESFRYRGSLVLTCRERGDLDEALLHAEILSQALAGTKYDAKDDLLARGTLTSLRKSAERQDLEVDDETLYRVRDWNARAPLHGIWNQDRFPPKIVVDTVRAGLLTDLQRFEEALVLIEELRPDRISLVVWNLTIAEMLRSARADEAADALEAELFDYVIAFIGEPAARLAAPRTGLSSWAQDYTHNITDPHLQYEWAYRWAGTVDFDPWVSQEEEDPYIPREEEWLPQYLQSFQAAEGYEKRAAGVFALDLCVAFERYDEALEIARALHEMDLEDRSFFWAYHEVAVLAGERETANALLAGYHKDEERSLPAPLQGATVRPADPLPRIGENDDCRRVFDEFRDWASDAGLASEKRRTLNKRIEDARLAWRFKDWPQVAQEFEWFGEEHPVLITQHSWWLDSLFDGEERSSVLLKILVQANPREDSSFHDYVMALIDEDNLEAAIAACEERAKDPATRPFATDLLRRIAPGHVAEAVVLTGDDLIVKVNEDPGNAQLCMQLVERLIAERRMEEAKLYGTKLLAIAAHLDEAQELYSKLLIACGTEEEQVKALRLKLKRGGSAEERVNLVSRLADIELAQGADLPRLRALIDQVDQPRPVVEDGYTMTLWWWENGFPDEAIRQLRDDIGKCKQDEWNREQLQDALDKYMGEAGDLTELDDVLEWGDLNNVFDVISGLPGITLEQALGSANGEEIKEVRIRAAFLRLDGDLVAAGQLVGEAADGNPLLRNDAGQAIDWMRDAYPEEALAIFDQLVKTHRPSPRRKVETSVGEVDEATLADAMRATMLADAGRLEEAEALLAEIYRRDEGLALGIAIDAEMASFAHPRVAEHPEAAFRLAEALGDELAQLEALEALAEKDGVGEDYVSRYYELLLNHDPAALEERAKEEISGDDLDHWARVEVAYRTSGIDGLRQLIDSGSLSDDVEREARNWLSYQYATDEDWRAVMDLGPNSSYYIKACVELEHWEGLPEAYDEPGGEPLRSAASVAANHDSGRELAAVWLAEAEEKYGPDPDVTRRAKTLGHLGRWDEAFETMGELMEDRTLSFSHLWEQAKGVPEEQANLWLERLTENDFVSVRSRAALACAHGTEEEALAALEALEVAGEDPHRILELRWIFYRDLEEWAKAADALDRLLRLDRRYKSMESDYYWPGSRPRDLFNLRRRAAGIEAACEEYLANYQPYRWDPYQLWNVNLVAQETPEELRNYLLNSGHYQEYLDRFEVEPPYDFRSSRAFEALDRRAEYLDNTHDPKTGNLVGAWSRLAFQEGDARERLTAMDGLTDEERSAVEAELAKFEGDAEGALAAGEVNGARLRQDPSAWLAAGRFEEVYDALLADTQGTGHLQSTFAEYQPYQAARLQFAYGVETLSGGSGGMIVGRGGAGMFYSFGSSSVSRSNVYNSHSNRDMTPYWIAAAFALGHDEPAEAAMKRWVKQRKLRGTISSLSEALMTAGLWERALECAALRHGETSGSYASIEERVLRIATAERNQELAERLLVDITNRELPEDGTKAARVLLSRAAACARAGVATETFLPWIEQARTLDAEVTPRTTEQPWIEMAMGRPATEAFQAELARLLDEGYSQNVARYGLAFSLHADGAPEAGVALRTAISHDPSSSYAVRARKLLGL